jgi:hypothetical protein
VQLQLDPDMLWCPCLTLMLDFAELMGLKSSSGASEQLPASTFVLLVHVLTRLLCTLVEPLLDLQDKQAATAVLSA